MTRTQRTRAIGFSRILGLRDSVALGLSLSVPLVLVVLNEAVFAAVGASAPVAYALAVLLYIPVVLSYMELAAGKRGSASAYQIAGSFNSSGLAFTVGWLMLAGLVSVAALVALALAERVGVWLIHLFDVEVGNLWLLFAVVFLAALNEWLSDIDRWRTRTAVVGLALAFTVGIVVWGYITHPPGGELREASLLGHDLTAVALLAGGLWCIDLLLNHRRQMRRPDATLKQASLIVWITTGILSVATAALAVRSPEIWLSDWSAKLSWGGARLEILGLVGSTTFCAFGLTRVVSRVVRLTGAMALEGFLPKLTRPGTGRRARALATLASMAVILVIAGWWVPAGVLMTLAAMTYLWITVLVMIPHARRPARELSPGRRNRLPLHPLFPGFSAAIAVFLSWILPLQLSAIGVGWLILGAAYYRLYARRKRSEVEKDTAVVGVGIEESRKDRPRIMICTESEGQLPSLLKSGTALARAFGGELMVLRVLPLPDELSLQSAQRKAEEEWESLDRLVEPLMARDVETQTVVRIAPSVESGFVATANEYDADALVMASPAAPTAVESSVAGVFSATSRPLAILQGDYPDTGASVTVATGGGPHATEALRLGEKLATGLDSSIELVSVSLPFEETEHATTALRRTLEDAALATDVPTRVIEAKTVEKGLQAEPDLLILGSSMDRLLGQTVFGGLPMEVAQARSGATIVVKRAEAAIGFWKRRLWEILSRILPNLSVGERAEVFSQMADDARANVDFYTLISLSSAIALLGLLLDSSAVIIGAMLVAPLMSPILALAHGIVQGNAHLLQRAGASTFKGTVVSIGVSTALTLLLPGAQATREILARVNPNLLDLGVAMAAGAAAAYAVSRKSVAAALPGVAISVALVPPLCVVGYGLGSSQFDIAGGALLLYLTNLAGIVLVGVVIFLMVGFRPTRVERGAKARQAALIAAISLLLVAIPLALTTVRVVNESALQNEMFEILEQLDTEVFDVESYSIERERDGFIITGTIYAYGEIAPGRVKEVQRRLSEAAGVPVRLRVTIVPAILTKAGEASDEQESEEPSPVVPSFEVEGLGESAEGEAAEVDPADPIEN